MCGISGFFYTYIILWQNKAIMWTTIFDVTCLQHSAQKCETAECSSSINAFSTRVILQLIFIKCQWCVAEIVLIDWCILLCLVTNASFSEKPPKASLVKNGSCPDELHGITSWLKHESYCYLPVSESKTWHDARVHCAKYGWHLVSIHSESENKFVHENMPDAVWSTKGWIGLYHDSKGNTLIASNCFTNVSYQIRKIAGCVSARNAGNVFHATAG